MIYDVIHNYYQNEFQKHCEIKQAMQKLEEKAKAWDELNEVRLEEIALEMEQLKIEGEEK